MVAGESGDLILVYPGGSTTITRVLVREGSVRDVTCRC